VTWCTCLFAICRSRLIPICGKGHVVHPILVATLDRSGGCCAGQSFRAVCGDRLLDFQGKGIQMPGYPYKHLLFSICGKIAQ
jgi:hypothetical protein